MNSATSEKNTQTKEEERLLKKLITLNKNLEKFNIDVQTLTEDNKKMQTEKDNKEKVIVTSRNDFDKRKLRKEITVIDKRINENNKGLNLKRPAKVQTEIDIKNLEKQLNEIRVKVHQTTNKEIEAQKEINNNDDQVKNIQEQIKERIKIEDKLTKDIQVIAVNDKKLEQQLSEEKNKEKKLNDEEINAKEKAETLKKVF